MDECLWIETHQYRQIDGVKLNTVVFLHEVHMCVVILLVDYCFQSTNLMAKYHLSQGASVISYSVTKLQFLCWFMASIRCVFWHWTQCVSWC